MSVFEQYGTILWEDKQAACVNASVGWLETLLNLYRTNAYKILPCSTGWRSFPSGEGHVTQVGHKDVVFHHNTSPRYLYFINIKICADLRLKRFPRDYALHGFQKAKSGDDSKSVPNHCSTLSSFCWARIFPAYRRRIFWTWQPTLSYRSALRWHAR